jgi:hypothetical protein
VNPPHAPDPHRRHVQAHIRAAAFDLLIGGALCLYLGYSLLIAAPGRVSEADAETWFAIDRVFRWCLRGLGVAFLIAAALAAAGLRVSMLLAMIVEGAFVVLMIVMAVQWTVEARVDGGWDMAALLLALLAIIGISSVRKSWSLYQAQPVRGFPLEQPPNA